MRSSDAFVMSVISLAFSLKNLVESDYYDEGKHKLIQDFAKLKERVALHTRILEQRETAKKFVERQKFFA